MKNLLFFIFLAETTKLIGPYVLKLIIDHISANGLGRISEIVYLIILLFVGNQLNSLSGFMVDRRIFRLLADSERLLPLSALRKMLFLDFNYHEKENTGNKIAKIQRGADKVTMLLSDMFWQVLPVILQLIFTVVILLFMSPSLALIFVVFTPIFMYLTYRLGRDNRPLRLARREGYEEISGQMAQSIININAVKSFVQEEREMDDQRNIADKIWDTSIREWRKLTNYNLGRNLILDIGRLSVLSVGAYLIANGQSTVGSLVFVYTITEKAILNLYRMSRMYDRIIETSEAVERLYELEETKPSVANPADGLKPQSIKGEIKFKDVSFVYSDANEPALDNVSFKIVPGSTTALIGPSGGGKTTVVKMIYRHYDPSSGRILLDDVDLKEYDVYAMRRFMAIVPQEVEVFNRSIRDNIAYANPDASQEEVESAARIANAEEFIDKLPQKYDTLVGERGIKLSGGQRQRIGIARAVLANPRILIFDEATSSLDSYSESLIQEAFDRISKDRTVIIIAHRLSTIKKADKIIVLEDGKVVEEGNHAELSHVKGGLYAKLLNLQKLGDVD